MQEIDCLVSTKEEDEEKGEVVVQGGASNIIGNTYIFTLSLHDEPDIESVGHGWKVTEFRLAQKLKMIV